MEAYTDSIEAAQNRITAAIEQWALFFNASDAFKDFYNAIAFATRNIHILGVIAIAMSTAMNFEKTVSALNSGFANLVTKLSSMSLSLQKSVISLKNGGGLTNTFFGDAAAIYNENYIVAQQKMYAKSLNAYTLSLDEATKQNLLNIQNMGLTLEAEQKSLLSKYLLQEIDEQQLSTGLQSLSTEQKEIFINAMLANLSEQEKNVKIEEIMVTETMTKRQAEYTLAIRELTKLRQKEAGQVIANNLASSARMPNAKSAAIQGIGNLTGGIAGGLIGKNIGSQFGDIGTIIGSMGGMALGSFAGKNLISSISSAAGLVKSFSGLSSLGAGLSSIGGGSALIGGLTVAGPIAAALGLVVGGVYSWIKKQKEEALKEAAEVYKEAQDKLVSAQSGLSKLNQYDELARGVDNLGRNISLTDEEYQEFLNLSTELAELYPELIVRTDDFGQSFVGVDGKVGAVSEEINELIESMQHYSNQALLDPTLFEDTFKQAKKEYENAKKEYDSLVKEKDNIINNEKTFQINTDDIESNVIHLSGDYNTLIEIAREFNKEWGTSLDVIQDVNDITKGTLNLYGTDQNGISIGGENILNSVNSILDNNNIFSTENISRDIEDAKKELNSAEKAMIDQANAIFQENDELYSAYKELTDEQKEFVKTIYQSTGFNGDENDFADDVIKNAEDALEALNENPQMIEFYYGFNEDMSGEEMQKATADFAMFLTSMFPNMSDEEKERILIKFGFVYDDQGRLSYQDDILSTIQAEGLTSKMQPDAQDSLVEMSVENLRYAYEILKGSIDSAKFSSDELQESIYNKKYTGSDLEFLVKYYEDYVDLQEEYAKDNKTLTKSQQKEFDRIKEGLDSYADQLGVVKGEYDEIIEKQKILGNLTSAGVSDLTPEEFHTKIEDFQEIYDYLSGDSFNGVWSSEMFEKALGNQELIPFIDDADKMMNFLESVLGDAEDYYDQVIQGVLIKTEAGSDKIIEINSDLFDAFEENYGIDLTKFTTLQESKLFIDAYTTALMSNDYATWLVEMSKYYSDDLAAFTTAAEQKLAMNALILSTMSSTSQDKYNNKKTEIEGMVAKGKYTEDEAASILSEYAFNLQREEFASRTAQMLADLKTAIDVLFPTLLSSNESSGSGSEDDALSNLEKLQKYRELIDKEWEAMEVYDENTKTYTHTEYFNKMRDVLNAQIAETKRLLSDTSLTEEEILDYEADLIELQKDLNNLNDEELEDEIKLLEIKDASVQALIEQQKLYIETADTEEELVERQKEMVELVREEMDYRRQIRSFQRDMEDYQLSYLSGTAYSDAEEYDALIQEKINSYKQDAAQALEEIQREINRAYVQFRSETDEHGNLLWTDEQALEMAKQTDEVQELTKEYMEAIEGQTETLLNSVNDKLDEISKNIELLESSKPQQWTSIDQIKEFSESTIAELTKKIPILEDALSDTSMMTDEQVQELIDQLNDVTIALHEAQITMAEEIRDYQESQYDAIVSKVEEYKEEIQDVIDDIEDAYDKEIEKLQDANDERERAIELTDLLTAKENAVNEKERVYREGRHYMP